MSTYTTMKQVMKEIVEGFEVLSGHATGQLGVTWQENAAATAQDLRRLAKLVETHTVEPVAAFPVFPNIREVV